MESIKETYNKIDAWLKLQDQASINFIRDQQRDYRNYAIQNLQDVLYYHEKISKLSETDKVCVFGDKTVSIDDIKNHMLSYIESRNLGPEYGETEEEWSEDSRDSGYAGMDEIREIISFWENLNNQAVLSVASGSVDDDYEININGHRWYLFSRSGVYPLLFNYIFYTLNKNLETLEDELCNSNDDFDEISEFFPPEDLFLPDTKEFEEICGKKRNEVQNETLNQFQYCLENILKNDRFQKEELLKEKLQIIKSIINEN